MNKYLHNLIENVIFYDDPDKPKKKKTKIRKNVPQQQQEINENKNQEKEKDQPNNQEISGLTKEKVESNRQYGPREVIYCKVCTLPPEYCFMTKTAKQCKVWLKEQYTELYDKLYPLELQNEQQQIFEESKQQCEEVNNDVQEKQVDRELKNISLQIEKPKIIKIRVVKREKNKYVTSISGLEKYRKKIKEILFQAINLKETQKKLAKRFSCGCRINVNIVEIQGDIANELVDFFCEEYPSIKEEFIQIKETCE